MDISLNNIYYIYVITLFIIYFNYNIYLLHVNLEWIKKKFFNRLIDILLIINLFYCENEINDIKFKNFKVWYKMIKVLKKVILRNY